MHIGKNSKRSLLVTQLLLFTFMEDVLTLHLTGDGSTSEVSDADYAEELQLQEALENSLAYLQISQSDNRSFRAGEVAGESTTIYCDICMEEKERHDIVKLESCSHPFCSECIAGHIQAKMDDNIHVITCPNLNCNYIIEPNSCQGIIPEDVLARWELAWSEATILDSQKFYCPYTNCSAMLVNDTEEGVIRESECPICRRLFCASCRVPWHQGFECEEFQKLKVDERGNDDLMLHVMAKDEKWTKCPNCKYLVDKIDGCIHMTCRCGFEFCYVCGLNWSESHWSCQTNNTEDD